MPSLTVDYSTPRPGGAALEARIAEAVLDLTERHLGKKRAVTSILVRECAATAWFIGGASLAELGQASHRTVIRVTEGTNTKAEKARYVAAVHEELVRLLGPMRSESYVVVEEVRADAWGWNGETQEHRAIAESLAREAETALVFDGYRRFGVR